jgi:hypothetical protein
MADPELVLRVALATVVVASALAATITGFVWAKSYSPLTVNGGTFAPDLDHLASVLNPSAEFDAKPVVYPRAARKSSFRVGFDVYNAGRFSIEIVGLVPPYPRSRLVSAVEPVGLRLQRKANVYSTDTRWTKPFRPVRVPSHESRFLVVEYRSRCRDDLGPGSELDTGGLELRYRYLRVFERTQTIETPYVIRMRCRGPLPHPA